LEEQRKKEGEILKKKISWMLCLLVLFVTCPISTQAVSAQGAVLLDGDSGQVLFEQNADAVLPMASTTKIMTALVAIEMGDLDRTYTVKDAYTRTEGSSMYLKVGEKLTIRETLYGLLLMSGNDAALAIAGECGGTEIFVAAMNQKAEALGLSHTHFENPSGLDGETHHTTARELGQLTAYAMQNPVFAQIVSTKNYSESGRSMVNHNKLLRLYPDAIGVKTGFTKKCGRCLVSAARRNGRTLICVTLNDPNDWQDHMNLYETFFAKYQPVTLHKAGDILRQVQVIGGQTSKVSLCAAHGCQAFLTEEEKNSLKTQVIGEKNIYALVKKGEIYGKIQYIVAGHVICQDDLYFNKTIQPIPEEKSWWQRLQDWMKKLV
jgi:D-alanyl-D-alanine carboxypeptidase (penicillin-binding protein 5/6)